MSLSSKENILLSKQEVTEYIYNVIQQTWPHLKLDIASDDDSDAIFLLIQTPEAGDFKYSPDDLYASYLQAPTELDAICQHFINALQDILDPDPNAPTSLMPSIQTQKWIDDVERERMQNSNGEQQSPTAFMPLVADLSVTFVLCRNQTYLYATEDLLAEFVEVDLPHLVNLSAIQVGIQTLREHLSEIDIEPTFAGYRISLDAIFDSSLIMIYEDWEHLLNLKGSPVFALIARDHFMVADNHNTEQVEQLKTLAQSAYASAAYPLSPALFSFENNLLTLYQSVLH